MIRTPICPPLDIEQPIALGGMGSATSPPLVAAVSRAGGLGALGCRYQRPQQLPRLIEDALATTQINHVSSGRELWRANR
jgi:NAD(P)H-dependent flavin oxidoreductase YrpB (nitropropane dioxygenase family)